MKEGNKTALLILAAGSSSRLGRPKQLLPWGNTNLLGHSIIQGKKAGINDIFVVTGAFHEEVVASVKDLEAQIVFNKNWSEGMGGSIASGVSEISKSKNSYAQLVIMVCDQPFVQAGFLKKLLAEAADKKQSVVATSYAGIPGVPAVFDVSVFESLQKLKGSQGAKSLLLALKEEVLLIEDDTITTDIDTMETYEQLFSQAFRPPEN
ncbi:NTP transferase domain-containing protein [Flavobacteriaceae bacterium M23B6Z8]